MIGRFTLTLLTIAISLYAYDSWSAQDLLIASPVGRTPGQFNVSASGSAQYSIPIWAPKGPNGVGPHIALTYNSQQGNGYVGVGWTLSGLSSIYRCNQTIAQDGTAAPVALATSDGYCMDGQRLRLTGGTYGATGSTYQTEIANFANVEANGNVGNGPATWQATDRNGWHYTYGGGGSTSNAQVLASGSNTAVSWQLNEVTDPYGNTMSITYSTTNATGVVVPNVISWVPESSGSTTYNETMTFSYGNGGVLSGYVGGTPFNNTNILSSIAVAYQGTAIKTYYLTYSNTTTATSRYLLTEVQECEGSGITYCLAPTKMTWQPGEAGVSSGVAVSGAVSSVISTAFDLNGDGINDLVFASSGSVYVALGSASGYGTPVNVTVSSAGAVVGDIDGSGVAGVLANAGGTWYFYKWNGSQIVAYTTGITVATAASPVLADLDGDGRADFAYTDSSGYVHVRLSTSTPGTVSFGSDINTHIGTGTPNLTIQAQIGGSNRALHFWGAAQADLLATEKTCILNNQGHCTGNYQYVYDTLHFTGSTFSTAAIPGGAIDFADYNDDGCTDVLTATELLPSACDGTVGTPIALPPGVTAVGGMDWNGDGRRDVLVAQSSGYLGVVLSTGTGLATTVINTSYPTSGTSYTAAPNLTGDGQDGLLALSGTSATDYPHSSPGAPPDLLASITDGFGNSASPSYVTIAQGSYTQETGATFPYQNYIGPMEVVNNVVFSDPSQVPGTGSPITLTYEYSGAVENLWGRGFQAFQSIETIDSRYVEPNYLCDFRYFETTFPWSGMQYQHLTSTGSTSCTVGSSFYPMQAVGTPNTLAQATLSSTTNEERYFPYFTNWTAYQREVDSTEAGDLITTTSTNFTFDSYGNATQVATTVTDNDPNSPYVNKTWTTTTTNTTDISENQSADLAAWCLGLIDETQVAYTSSLSGSTAVTRTKTFTPDTPALCRIKTITTEPTANGGEYKVTEALTFDSFGNVATDTVTGATMPSSPASRESQFNWGTTGQFLNSFQDPSGAVTSWTYTSDQALTFGVPDSMTDPNSLTTYWGYDNFGRKTSETRPDSTSTTWTWNWCTSYCSWSNSVYQIAQALLPTSGTAIRTDTNYYDPVDRVTETSGPNVSNSTVIVQKLYNSFGLLEQQSMPFLSGNTAYQTTMAYDLLNRISSVTRPIGFGMSGDQSTTFSYAGRTSTVTDPMGDTNTTITDVNGWLREAEDGVGYEITRSYDAAGSLIGITDSVGNTLLSGVSYAYGIKPFLLSATDADLGAWVYTVDSLGERTGWTDAKGQSFSMTFDALSRPLSRTEPDLFTQWVYGSTPASYNMGRLVSECTGIDGECVSSSGYSETRTFDSFGRLSQRSIVEGGNPGNDPGGVFLFTFGYNSTTGFLNTLTYPTSTASYALNLQYGCNPLTCRTTRE